MLNEQLTNISERNFLGELLLLLRKPVRISTILWAETYRVLTKEESFHSGKFDCNKVPALEYIYDCLDNRFIPIIVVMKASQVGWSELTNNFIGKTIHTAPCKMQWTFPGREVSSVYSREKLKPFFAGTPVLNKIINVNVLKPSFNYFKFPGGFLKLTTAGAIGSSKSSAIPFIGVEEPDDVKDDISGQGDTLENLKGRQKSFPVGHKKLIFGGTPTFKDFSKVEAGYKESNQLVFKACCHVCKELSELSFKNLFYDEYQNRGIHEIYGKHDPETAYYVCVICQTPWDWEQKELNIVEGKKYGFIDNWGKFSKGWHSKKPEVIDAFGFHVPELLSSFSERDYIGLARKKIKATVALGRGNEYLMKSFVNNSEGFPYASGLTAIETEELRLLRSNYPEHIVPYEGLELTCGIDVQENRFAVVIRAWGRNNNSWLVSWFEIFGDTKNPDSHIWTELAEKTVFASIPHVTGKTMRIKCISIDSGDNTTFVYDFVNRVQNDVTTVLATKGVGNLAFNEDEVYMEPGLFEITNLAQERKTVAERMGITLFKVGSNKAMTEVLSRIMLNKNKDARSYVHYFNYQSYGQYEEQLTSCRKIIETKSGVNKEIYKLIPGKRKEAFDCEKLALHANYAVGIRNYTSDHWKAIEDWLYN